MCSKFDERRRKVREIKGEPSFIEPLRQDALGTEDLSGEST